jgi:tetratricopeptide (TPR) repeat protein
MAGKRPLDSIQQDTKKLKQTDTMEAQSAVEMYYASLEERESLDSDIVQRMFEQALGAFEEEFAAGDCSNRVVYASCLYDFAMHMNIPKYFTLAIAEFQKCSLDSEEPDIFMRLGLAQANCAQLLLEQQAEDDDKDGVPLASDIKNLIDKSLSSFHKAIHNCSTADANIGASDVAAVAAGKMLDLILLLKDCRINLSSIQEYLEASFNFVDTSADSVYVQRIKGMLYFHLSSIQSQSEDIDVLSTARANARTALGLFQEITAGEAKASDYQLVLLLTQLGQAAVLLSSLEFDDDDKAIEAFDIAVNALQEALRLDPEDQSVRQQLADMEMLDECSPVPIAQ